MRYLYGLISGIFATLLAAILYLAMAGGEYVLRLSPEVHDLRTRLRACEGASGERAELRARIGELEQGMAELKSRLSMPAPEREMPDSEAERDADAVPPDPVPSPTAMPSETPVE